MTNEELVSMVQKGATDMAKLCGAPVTEETAGEVAEFCVSLAKKLYTVGFCAGVSHSSAMAIDTARAVAKADEDGKVQSTYEAVTGPLYEAMLSPVSKAIEHQQRMFLAMLGVEANGPGDVQVVRDDGDLTTMPGGDA